MCLSFTQHVLQACRLLAEACRWCALLAAALMLTSELVWAFTRLEPLLRGSLQGVQKAQADTCAFCSKQTVILVVRKSQILGSARKLCYTGRWSIIAQQRRSNFILSCSMGDNDRQCTSFCRPSRTATPRANNKVNHWRSGASSLNTMQTVQNPSKVAVVLLCCRNWQREAYPWKSCELKSCFA